MISMRAGGAVLCLGLAACGGGGGDGGGAAAGSVPPSVVGVWEGVLHSGASTAAGQLAFLDDGTVLVRANSGSAWEAIAGTYALADHALTFSADTSPGHTVLFAGTLDQGHLTGTFGAAPSSTDRGTFDVSLVATAGTGIWKGTYATSSDSFGYLLIAFPAGSLEVRDGATLADRAGQGTWSLAGAAFTASYTYSPGDWALAATLDGDTLTGTWGTPPAATDGGTFTVARER